MRKLFKAITVKFDSHKGILTGRATEQTATGYFVRVGREYVHVPFCNVLE